MRITEKSSQSDQPLEHVVIRTSGIVEPLGIVPISALTEFEYPLRVRTSIDLPSPETLVLHDRSLKNSRSNNTITIGVNVSARSIERTWPVDRIEELARDIAKLGYDVRLFGLPSDKEIVERIASRTSTLALPGGAKYEEFAGILAACDLVITPDSSTVHLSSALGIPVIALYADQAHSIEWRPWGVPHRVLWGNGSIQNISIESVIEAMKELRTEGAGIGRNQTDFSTDFTAGVNR